MKTLTHEEVAQRAYQIWQNYGGPVGRDNEIWLEAERQLSSDSSESGQGAALAQRLKDETAAESEVEYHLSPPTSREESVKAALQQKEARAPKVPHTSAPKHTPPTSGKPLWSKPHSS